MIKQTQLTIATTGRGMFDITQELVAEVRDSNIITGLCHIFIHHTSASLLICENADEKVQVDLETFMHKLVPDGDPMFIHTAEGPDDMPAHVRNVLTASFLNIPVTEGKLALGTWQGIYLWEHRKRAYQRHLTCTLLGAS